MEYAKSSLKSEWKMYFETVMMEMRNGYFEKAERIVRDSLQIHSSTGRLWASLIQIEHAKSKREEDFCKAH
jgi:hypothetical protein